jgi:hypothetical protein
MALSEETRSEGINAALKEGAVATAGVSVALAAAHVFLRRSSVYYTSIPASPLRLLAAIIVTGTFTYVSGVSHANHTTRSNIKYMEACEEKENARRAAIRGAKSHLA